VSTSNNSSVAEHAEGQGQIPAETTTQVNRVLSPLKESDRSATKKTPSRTKAVAEDSDPETGAEFEEIVQRSSKTTADLKKAQDDPFKPENLRLDQSVLQAQAAKRLLITVPVRKPNKQDFVRVHPDPEYRVEVALLDYERDTYLIVPQLCAELTESEYYVATIHVAINRQKVVFLWPVKLPGADGRQMDWHISAAEAAEKARDRWVRVTANMSLGAYEVFEAVADYGDPEWPTQSFWDLIKIAFKNRLIDNADHLIIQKLRGLA
jgi:hypothetical protein